MERLKHPLIQRDIEEIMAHFTPARGILIGNLIELGEPRKKKNSTTADVLIRRIDQIARTEKLDTRLSRPGRDGA